MKSQETLKYQWFEVTGKAAFAPRDGAGALVFHDKMRLIGGWNPEDKTHFPLICNNEVWSSKNGAVWTMEKPNTFLTKDFDPKSDWEGRHSAGYVVFNDRMWIVGGDCNQGHYQNDVWSSADGKKWECLADQVPWAPRILHHTVAFKDKIWVMGGQSRAAKKFGLNNKTEFYDDVWASADGANWERVEVKRPAWPPRGQIGGSAVFKDRIWLLGGGTYDTPDVPTRQFYNDVWSSGDGVHWERHIEHAAWHPRQYHEVAVFDDKMWVMEGWNKDSGNRKDVWYSDDGIEWQELPDTPWKPRHAASVFVHDNALWMVAGNNMESDVWRLERMPSKE